MKRAGWWMDFVLLDYAHISPFVAEICGIESNISPTLLAGKEEHFSCDPDGEDYCTKDYGLVIDWNKQHVYFVCDGMVACLVNRKWEKVLTTHGNNSQIARKCFQLIQRDGVKIPFVC